MQMTPGPYFKVRHYLTLNISETVQDWRQRHSYNEILIGTYIQLAQRCNFEWPWGLSDLSFIHSFMTICRAHYVENVESEALDLRSWVTARRHGASRGLSATAECFVHSFGGHWRQRIYEADLASILIARREPMCLLAAGVFVIGTETFVGSFLRAVVDARPRISFVARWVPPSVLTVSAQAAHVHLLVPLPSFYDVFDHASVYRNDLKISNFLQHMV